MVRLTGVSRLAPPTAVRTCVAKRGEPKLAPEIGAHL